MGGGGGGDGGDVAGSDGVDDVGDDCGVGGRESDGGGGGVGCGSDGDGGGGGVGGGCDGDVGGGGDEQTGESSPNVMFRAVSSVVPRSCSGVIMSSLDAERRVASAPLLLEMAAALWLALLAVKAAFIFFTARGLVL